MFSSEKRCVYNKNQLVDVICQLRFPEILSIETNLPADFQESIRSQFPKFSANKESSAPRIVGTPGHFNLDTPRTTVNYQFSTADNIWQLNLTSTFIALACKRYTCWEDFAAKLDNPLVSFIKIYKPAYFERVGLRYINFFSRNELEITDVPFRELFTESYVGILSDENVDEHTVIRSSVEAEFSINGGCHAKILSGPGRVKKNGIDDGEVKFIFDQDLFMKGNIPVNYSAGALQTLHSQAYPIFRNAITNELHNALEPKII